MSKVRDLPTVSGRIVWSRQVSLVNYIAHLLVKKKYRQMEKQKIFLLNCVFQIEHQLNALLSHVEVVLGKGWENHVEGQQLKNDGESFRLKLNTQELFEDWQRRVRKPFKWLC